MPRAWIQLAESHWGTTAVIKGTLASLGYHVEELRGNGPPWLWVAGGRAGHVPVPPRRDAGAREPLLQQAMPADAVPGSAIDADVAAEIRLRDGSWVPARVLAQRRDRKGRWCVFLRWSTGIGGREGAFLYDPEFIRRMPGED